jgi:hypothetical protein
MALKGPRLDQGKHDISFFMNETAERGGVVVVSTVGSGDAMDSASQVATYAVNPSGKRAVGLLKNDVVNKDLTQTHLDYYKDEVQVGSKVTIAEEGDFLTDMIVPGVSPAGGDNAYLGASGKLTNSQFGTAPLVGYFKTTKDADGFAKVHINL